MQSTQAVIPLYNHPCFLSDAHKDKDISSFSNALGVNLEHGVCMQQARPDAAEAVALAAASVAAVPSVQQPVMQALRKYHMLNELMGEYLRPIAHSGLAAE